MSLAIQGKYKNACRILQEYCDIFSTYKRRFHGSTIALQSPIYQLLSPSQASQTWCEWRESKQLRAGIELPCELVFMRSGRRCRFFALSSYKKNTFLQVL